MQDDTHISEQRESALASATFVPALSPWQKKRPVDMVTIVCTGLATFAVAVLLLSHGLPLPVLLFLMATAIGTVVMMVRYSNHLSQRNRYEERLCEVAIQLTEKNKTLKELVQIDPLTDVLNRRGLERSLTAEMSRARRQGTRLYAMLIDCDDFKQVNDKFGHAVGDIVLQRVAQSLVASVRLTDYVSRIGGDEFLVLLIDLGPEEVAMIAERIRLNLSESSIDCGESQLKCTVSVGAAELPKELSSIEELLTLTRMALKTSKQDGKNRITVSSVLQAESSQVISERELTRIVQTLISGSGLRNVRQPIYNLADKSIVGYEILARGPRGPFEMPGDLFRLARENNVMTPLDMRCFKMAVASARLGEKSLRYHVNLFPASLLDFPLESLAELFQDLKVTLCVEISEQQYIGNVSCLMQHVDALRKCGVLVALDDVGHGRSTLESILALSPNVLKMHPQLVKRCTADDAKKRQIERLLVLSRSLDCEVVAEGIEDEPDMRTLIELGVTRGQGYLWGFPEEMTSPDDVVAVS